MFNVIWIRASIGTTLIFVRLTSFKYEIGTKPTAFSWIVAFNYRQNRNVLVAMHHLLNTNIG